MDRPRHNNQVAVNKIGKKIKKTPLHNLPSLANGNLSKNGFRSMVPQLTSSSPTPQKIRPAALTKINRRYLPPAMSQPTLNLATPQLHPLPMMQPSHQCQSYPPGVNGDGILPSPVSSQRSFGDSGPNRSQMQPSHDYQQAPRFSGSASSVPILPSPRFNGRGILPTPPRSFTFSSMAHVGILGPGKFPQPPHASPGLVFPPLPFGENTN